MKEQIQKYVLVKPFLKMLYLEILWMVGATTSIVSSFKMYLR